MTSVNDIFISTISNDRDTSSSGSMSAQPSLSLISDPTSLAKIQILIVPVHLPRAGSETGSALTEPIYQHWASLIKRHQTLRGDEIRRPSSKPSHTRGGAFPDNAKHRFFPSPSHANTSMSSRAPGVTTGHQQHVHLTYPSHPPARHLYPLSLLRMAGFPLVVIGIAVDMEDRGEDAGEARAGPSSKLNGNSVKGYAVDEVNEDEEQDTGDIGEASTPVAPTFREIAPRKKSSPSSCFSDTLSALFPDTSPFPLVRRLILVPPHLPSAQSARSPSGSRFNDRSTPRPNGDRGKRREDLEGEVQKAPEDGGDSWIGRLMGEVIGDVLGELGEVVSGLCRIARIELTIGNLVGNFFGIENIIFDIIACTHGHNGSPRHATRWQYPNVRASSTSKFSHASELPRHQRPLSIASIGPSTHTGRTSSINTVTFFATSTDPGSSAAHFHRPSSRFVQSFPPIHGHRLAIHSDLFSCIHRLDILLACRLVTFDRLFWQIYFSVNGRTCRRAPDEATWGHVSPRGYVHGCDQVL